MVLPSSGGVVIFRGEFNGRLRHKFSLCCWTARKSNQNEARHEAKSEKRNKAEMNCCSSSCGSLSSAALGPMIVGPAISVDDWVPARPPKKPHLRAYQPPPRGAEPGPRSAAEPPPRGVELPPRSADLPPPPRAPSPDLPPPSPPPIVEEELLYPDEPLPPPPPEEILQPNHSSHPARQEKARLDHPPPPPKHSNISIFSEKIFLNLAWIEPAQFGKLAVLVSVWVFSWNTTKSSV